MVRFLFKQAKPKRFDYKPRFYSERKEFLKARIERVQREGDDANGAGSEAALRSRMGDAWRNKALRKDKAGSNRMVAMITALLALVAYLLLN